MKWDNYTPLKDVSKEWIGKKVYNRLILYGLGEYTKIFKSSC